MRNNAGRTLEDFRAPVKIKLALLWASLMFLYICNDYFSLYTPGKIDDIAAGRIGSLGEATEPVMVGVSMLLAVPALMIFLSVALAPPASRWLNIVLGLAYTAIEALTLRGRSIRLSWRSKSRSRCSLYGALGAGRKLAPSK